VGRRPSGPQAPRLPRPATAPPLVPRVDRRAASQAGRRPARLHGRRGAGRARDRARYGEPQRGRARRRDAGAGRMAPRRARARRTGLAGGPRDRSARLYVPARWVRPTGASVLHTPSRAPPQTPDRTPTQPQFYTGATGADYPSRYVAIACATRRPSGSVTST